MRPKSLALAGIAGLIACAPAADAAVRSGTFKGRTDTHQPVQFTVTKSKKVTDFAFRGVELNCSDGEYVKLGRIDSDDAKLTVKRGKFSFSADYEDGANWRANGTILGRRAKGKLRFRVSFTAEGEPDPDGDVVCDSGTRRFEAKLR